MAGVVASDNVAYQAYFYGGQEAIQFQNSPNSIAAYRRHFGAYGDAVSASLRGAQHVDTSGAPSLIVTNGPQDGSTVATGAIVFSFRASAGYLPYCSVDGQPPYRCSSTSLDVVRRLAPGFHSWNVTIVGSRRETAIAGRTFVVSGDGL
jgi:hypothetical protein